MLEEWVKDEKVCTAKNSWMGWVLWYELMGSNSVGLWFGYRTDGSRNFQPHIHYWPTPWKSVYSPRSQVSQKPYALNGLNQYSRPARCMLRMSIDECLRAKRAQFFPGLIWSTGPVQIMTPITIAPVIRAAQMHRNCDFVQVPPACT